MLANLSAARTAKVAAETKATVHRTRLVQLGRQAQFARSALEQSTIDSYIGGGGPLGEMAAALESLTSPSLNLSASSLATVNYLIKSRAQLINQAKSMQSAEVTMSTRATAAIAGATSATNTAARAKSAMDAVIARQQTALDGVRAAETVQIRRAAGLRITLLRSGSLLAKTADRQLARALGGRDYTLLMEQSSSCGNGAANYSSGRRPSSARCVLYAAPDQSLRRAAALSLNAMSFAYERQSGSALCVTEGYRSYAEQVAVKQRLPQLAATPGTSKHGLGLAVDLCGGVQDFSAPAYLWLDRNASRYGRFHPAWAEPAGVLPEAWHWEFAG